MVFNVRGDNGRLCKNEENQGKISGLLNPTSQFCEWRRISKIYPYLKFLRENGFKEEDVLCYVGFTIDETNRTKRWKNEAYPLIDKWQMGENDCKEYLKRNEMENPLYRHFNRTGCRLCVYQSERDFYHIWLYYPEVWEEFKYYEEMVLLHQREAINSHWFINFQTCEDMEIKFKRWQSFGFEIDDEPLKDCFCKI